MDDETARALNALNVAFYTDHAEAFSARRTRPWRGWSRLLARLPQTPLSVLDVGCGNGRFGRFLAGERRLARYQGVDVSAPLLEIARRDPPAAASVGWRRADFVASPDAALPGPPFDLVVLFGVLHGVPGEARRRALVEACVGALAPGGLLAFTCWRFARDPRIAGRLDRPEAWPPGIDATRLGPGDHLLPWGDEGRLHRYVADVDAAERERLLAGLPLERMAEFHEDGTGGDLNHYTLARRTRSG
ncbi:MAG: class I SAM-dependent methyltransferase [Myxococcota bacterium]